VDFNPPNVPPINMAPEAAVFTSPYPRLRHAAVSLESPIVDLIAGQYWALIGFITYFDPSSIEIPFVPGALAARPAQLRISRTVRSHRVNLELAAAVLKGPQNNAALPDGQFGLRVLFNELHALRTDYALGPTFAERAGFAISGAVRRLTVPSVFPGSGMPPVNNPPQRSALGYALAIDFILPIIPKLHRTGNALTLTANFLRGQGRADLLTGPPPGGGGVLPLPPGCINPTTSAAVPNCIDPGLVSVDGNGRLQAIGWQTFVLGLQYYLPPSGRAWVSFVFSQLSSDNIAQFADPQRGWALARYYNANLVYDITPTLRAGLGYMLFAQYNLDGAESRNHRAQLSMYYRF
jgi:hypothetical protein